MSFEETIEKSKALDRLLRFDDNTQPEHSRMPLPSFNLDATLAKIATTMSKVQTKLEAELEGLAQDIEANGEASVQKVRAHRKATNDAFGTILGNEMAHTSGDAENPTNGTGAKAET